MSKRCVQNPNKPLASKFRALAAFAVTASVLALSGCGDIDTSAVTDKGKQVAESVKDKGIKEAGKAKHKVEKRIDDAKFTKYSDYASAKAATKAWNFSNRPSSVRDDDKDGLVCEWVSGGKTASSKANK